MLTEQAKEGEKVSELEERVRALEAENRSLSEGDSKAKNEQKGLEDFCVAQEERLRVMQDRCKRIVQESEKTVTLAKEVKSDCERTKVAFRQALGCTVQNANALFVRLRQLVRADRESIQCFSGGRGRAADKRGQDGVRPKTEGH